VDDAVDAFTLEVAARDELLLEELAEAARVLSLYEAPAS
jgi:hypothetical protein